MRRVLIAIEGCQATESTESISQEGINQLCSKVDLNYGCSAVSYWEADTEQYSGKWGNQDETFGAILWVMAEKWRPPAKKEGGCQEIWQICAGAHLSFQDKW